MHPSPQPFWEGSTGWPRIPPLRGYRCVTSGRFWFECGVSGASGASPPGSGQGRAGSGRQGVPGGFLMGGFCRDSFAWHQESNGQTRLSLVLVQTSNNPAEGDGDPPTQAKAAQTQNPPFDCRKNNRGLNLAAWGMPKPCAAGVRSCSGSSSRWVLGQWDFSQFLPAPRDLPGARSIPAREQPGRGDAGSGDLFAAGRRHFATGCQIPQNFTLCKHT